MAWQSSIFCCNCSCSCIAWQVSKSSLSSRDGCKGKYVSLVGYIETYQIVHWQATWNFNLNDLVFKYGFPSEYFHLCHRGWNKSCYTNCQFYELPLTSHVIFTKKNAPKISAQRTCQGICPPLRILAIHVANTTKDQTPLGHFAWVFAPQIFYMLIIKNFSSMYTRYPSNGKF